MTDELITCDRCGTPCAARGWRAINKDGRVIDLCHVHFRTHRDALVKQNWTLLELASVERGASVSVSSTGL